MCPVVNVRVSALSDNRLFPTVGRYNTVLISTTEISKTVLGEAKRKWMVLIQIKH